jgi:tetratricopeptide (TPR) repeat protein
LSVPLTIDRIDLVNDLAILSADVAIDAPELPIQPGRPVVGARIWAIGNPRGLENSMSEGLISGIRTLEGRTLLQISAAISHGSSGGPIVNAAGQVVGVTVATLETGQNLNFAVPADILSELLDGNDVPGTGFAAAIAGITALMRDLPSIMDDYAGWSAGRTKIEAALSQARSMAQSGDDYLQLATLALASPASNDSARTFAVEALAHGTMQPDSARALYLLASVVSLRFAQNDTAEYISSALRVANRLLQTKPQHFGALRARALSLHLMGRKAEALAAVRLELTSATDSVTKRTAWSDNHFVAASDGSASQDDQVFEDMVSAGFANSWDWAQHGEHMESREDWLATGLAYAQAFALSNQYGDYACKAGRAFWIADSTDTALAEFRACLTANATASYPDTSNIVFAHRAIASLLNGRGVYSEAESHARQALTLADGKEGAFAAIELARALNNEGRYTEAAAAAESAVRLSDGSLYSAHFQLGSAYAELNDWKRCVTAFENAARLNSTDYTAAYNLAICNARQGFYRDGVRWLNVAVQRHPPAAVLATIQEMIGDWKRR